MEKTPHRRLKILLAVAAIGLGLGLAVYWDAFPGTYYKDANGFPHGTGQAEYHYQNGKLMSREWYFRGLLQKATWFRPDGSEITTETYDKTSGGAWYTLREDGSIKSKHTSTYSREDNAYIGDDAPVYFDRNGLPMPDATEPID